MALQQSTPEQLNAQELTRIKALEAAFLQKNATVAQKQAAYTDALKLGVDNHLTISKHPQLGIYVFEPQAKATELNRLLRTMQEAKVQQGTSQERAVNRAKGVLDAVMYRVEHQKDKLQVMHDTIFALRDTVKGTITPELLVKHKDKVKDPVLKSALGTIVYSKENVIQEKALQSICDALNKQYDVASNTVTQSQDAQKTVTEEVKNDIPQIGKTAQEWISNTFKGLQNPLRLMDNPFSALAVFFGSVYAVKKVGFMRSAALLFGGEIAAKLMTGGKHGIFGALGETFGWAQENIDGKAQASYQIDLSEAISATKEAKPDSREMVVAAALGALPLTALLNKNGGAVHAMEHNLNLEFFHNESALAQVYTKDFPTHVEHMKKHGVTHTELATHQRSLFEAFYTENKSAIDTYIGNRDTMHDQSGKMSTVYKVHRYMQALTSEKNITAVLKDLKAKEQQAQKAGKSDLAKEYAAAQKAVSDTLRISGATKPNMAAFLALFSNTDNKYQHAEEAIKKVTLESAPV